jgi:alpha-glucosidase
VAVEAPQVNVAVARQEPAALLTFYHRLLHLRRALPALAVGAYTLLEVGHDVLAYVRTGAGQRFLMVLNLGPHPQQFAARQAAIQGRVVLSTHLDRTNEAVQGTLALRGDEGVILELA